MIGNIGDIESDEKLSTGGVPLELGGGRVLYVRQSGGHNRRWRVELSKALQEADDEELLDAQALDDRRYRAFRVAASQALVARWEGFEDEEGEPLEGSPAAYLELFERVPDAFEAVIGLASSEEEYRLKADTKSGADGGRVGGGEP